jgi:hypothetical protein
MSGHRLFLAALLPWWCACASDEAAGAPQVFDRSAGYVVVQVGADGFVHHDG